MTPENLVFRDAVPVGIVDFDLAGPTTRLLDIVTTLRWWAPLADVTDRDPLFADFDVDRVVVEFAFSSMRTVWRKCAAICSM